MDENKRKSTMEQFVEAGLEMLAHMKVFLDTLDGYRAECMRRGYTPEQAAQMAADVHHVAMNPTKKDDDG